MQSERKLTKEKSDCGRVSPLFWSNQKSCGLAMKTQELGSFPQQRHSSIFNNLPLQRALIRCKLSVTAGNDKRNICGFIGETAFIEG